MGHAYSIELRFFGEMLDPIEVTSIMGLQPSTSSNGKELVIGKKVEPFWGYNGHDVEMFQAEWNDMEQGFVILFSALTEKINIINSLSVRYKALWWCGHFQSSFDGGPIFSNRLIARLNEFKIPLFLDCYFCDDE